MAGLGGAECWFDVVVLSPPFLAGTVKGNGLGTVFAPESVCATRSGGGGGLLVVLLLFSFEGFLL